MDKLLLIGFGGQAKVVIYTLKQLEKEYELHYLDQKKKKTEINYIGDVNENSFSEYKELGGKYYHCCIGNNKLRKIFTEQAKKFDLTPLTIIHPQTSISEDVIIGHGTSIFANSVIHPGSVIGNHVILNTGSQVDHDTTIQDYGQLAPGSITGGEVEIKEGVMIGMGAIVTPRKKIGEWSVIGAGAVVTRDIPDHVTAWGIPAKIIYKNES